MKTKRLLVVLLSLIMLSGMVTSAFAGGGSQSGGAKTDKLHFV